MHGMRTGDRQRPHYHPGRPVRQLSVERDAAGHRLRPLPELEILGNAARLLADRAIAGFRINQEVLTRALERNPILVTALNAVIGYEKGAEIAKKAYKEGRAVRDVARDLTGLSETELARLLDPAELTKGGIREKP